jgi:N-acetyl-gamma-glutamylphosphate reductase
MGVDMIAKELIKILQEHPEYEVRYSDSENGEDDTSNCSIANQQVYKKEIKGFKEETYFLIS